MMSRRTPYLLLVILLLASGLRLFHLTRHDSYTDEAILAFRSIGLIDYAASPSQTTPWQWFPAVPAWAHLSMHDHPILFFLLQHIAYRLFGVGLVAVRLPAVAAGVGSVWLMWLIGKRLFSEPVGLLAALIMSIQSYSLWVSRVGIQDGVIVFFLLLAFYFLLHTRVQPRAWLYLGLTIGVGIITKYTMVIIFPIIIWYAWLYQLRPWREHYAWYGLITLAIVTSPSWLYNLFLYHATGHLDFQLSAFFHENVPEWSFRLGRLEIGGLSDRFINFWRALYYANSLLFNAVSAAAVAFSAICVTRTRDRALAWLLGSTGIMYFWFFVIGSTYRFVVMIIPFFILLIAWAMQEWQSHIRPIWLACSLLAGFCVLEFLFSVNSFLLLHQFGQKNFAYAQITEETQNYGFNQLDAYLDTTLHGQMSALFGSPDYHFLTDLVNAHLNQVRATGTRARSLVIIYDHDLNFIADLWVLKRRLIYEGWPIIADDEFLSLAGAEKENFYRKQGVQEFIYIATVSEGVRRIPADRPGQRNIMTAYLAGKGVQPMPIRNQAGDTAFLVYQF